MTNTDHCRTLVRAENLDAYLATLLAPQPAQSGLFAIHAFAADVMRLPWRVSEPALGLIRLQWWREALEQDTAPDHPIARVLVRTAGDTGLLAAFLDTQERLYGAPFSDADEVEEWARAAFSPLLRQLIRQCRKGATEEMRAVLPAATAFGLTHVLRRAAIPRATGLPLLSGPLATGEGVAILCDRAASAMKQARKAHPPRAALPALWPASLSDLWLKRIRAMGEGVLERPPQLSQLRRQAALAWRAMRGLC